MVAACVGAASFGPRDGAASLPRGPKLPQYEECVLALGFDDVAAYATFDNEDVEAMEEALLTAGVPPGHVGKIVRTVRECQDPELRHKAYSFFREEYAMNDLLGKHRVPIVSVL